MSELAGELDIRKKHHFQSKISEYIKRAEQIKAILPDVNSRGQVLDKISIMEGESGYGYERIFGKYLDANVTEILIEEPYIKEYYQVKPIYFFLNFKAKFYLPTFEGEELRPPKFKRIYITTCIEINLKKKILSVDYLREGCHF